MLEAEQLEQTELQQRVAVFLLQLPLPPPRLSQLPLLSLLYRRCPSLEPAARLEQRSLRVRASLARPFLRRGVDVLPALHPPELRPPEAELRLRARLRLDAAAKVALPAQLRARASRAPISLEFARPDRQLVD